MRNPKYFGMTCKMLFNIELLPIQVAILQELWTRPFPMLICSRGFGKSFLLAILSLLKCVLIPGTKVVVVGSAFRQSKVVFEYMETIWKNAPVLRSLCDSNSGPRRDVDRCTMHINDSWAIAIPLGDGSKIRGLRAHVIIADEFASINPDIYETVVAGFAAVSSTPVDNVKNAAKRRYFKDTGAWSDELQELYDANHRGNQAIISGTADYDFKHFADYWKRYRAIVESKGDPDKIAALFGDEIPDSFDWKDYCVIRVPYELVPEGFMDDKQVSRAKATMRHSSIYNMEYGAVFVKDSEGFFKRSLIDSCVASDAKPIITPNGSVWFDALTRGNPQRQYVYGIDPASEQDNFTISVLELHEDHTRLVYAWSTNRKNFKKRLEAGLAKEHDYYGFCARKIRDLMKTFPPVRIGMDSQGGGIAVLEALHDPDKMYDGEQFIWPIIDPEKEADTDGKQGLHLIELINFADSKWTGEANHGLKKDMEDKVIMFPRFDPVTLGLAAEEDGQAIKAGDISRMYDSLEDCVMEIEELKNELSIIVLSKTPTGREHWDTPETKEAGGKKGRLKKDRYSSLLIANMLARKIHRTATSAPYLAVGGFAHMIDTKQLEQAKSNQMYVGAENIIQEFYGVQYQAIRRNGV
jgi:hypothetical protein